MKENSCFLSGHRELSFQQLEELTPVLYQAAEEQIKKGYTHFYVGGSKGFDTRAEVIITRLKKIYSNIQLTVVLPFPPREKYYSLGGIDEVYILYDHYQKGCLQQRNRYMVEQCASGIIYSYRKGGLTAYTKKYAEELGLEIINIAPEKKKQKPREKAEATK